MANPELTQAWWKNNIPATFGKTGVGQMLKTYQENKATAQKRADAPADTWTKMTAELGAVKKKILEVRTTALKSLLPPHKKFGELLKGYDAVFVKEAKNLKDHFDDQTALATMRLDGVKAANLARQFLDQARAAIDNYNGKKKIMVKEAGDLPKYLAQAKAALTKLVPDDEMKDLLDEVKTTREQIEGQGGNVPKEFGNLKKEYDAKSSEFFRTRIKQRQKR